MHIHARRALLAAVLAGLCALVLAGCSIVDAIVYGLPDEATPEPSPAAQETARPSASEAIQEPTAQPVAASGQLQLVPFPQMVYTRPDVEAVTDELESIAASLEGVADDQTALGLMDRSDAIFDSYMTAATLAHIHNSINTADPYWAAENAYCGSGLAAVQTASLKVASALRNSPAAQAAGIEPSSGQSVMESAAMTQLLQTESTLVAQYQSLLDTLSVNWNGAEVTYMQTDDGSYGAWLSQNAPALGEIYVSLLKVRREIANTAGYSNYLEYAAAVDGFDPAGASRMLDEISQYMTPVYAAVMGKGVYQMDDKFTQEVVLQNLSDWIGGFDPSMQGALDLMRAYLLYDLSDGPNKQSGAYTTYIADYGAPFLYATVDGTCASMQDVIHEFGHFYCYTRDADCDLLPNDTAEVPSTALPLLLSSQYGTTYGSNESGAMLYNQLEDCLSTFPEQAYYTGFELAAYQLPVEDITYENLCAVAQQQWDRFGLSRTPLAPVEWTTTVHLFEVPFYTFAYIPATDVALQIWEQSTENLAAARATYNQFIDMAPVCESLTATVETCGLASPYAPGEIQRQAEWLTRYLVNGEAMPSEAPEETPAATPSPSASTTDSGQSAEADFRATSAPTPQPTPDPTPKPTQEPTQAWEPTPGPTVVSTPDGDRYGEHVGITDGSTTLWSAKRAA